MTRPFYLALFLGGVLVLAGIPLACAQPSGEHATRPLPSEEAGSLASDPPAPGTLFLTTERFRLEDGAFAKVERGHLYVPMDRSDPDSPTISVEVYRFPATTETAAERPPIFRLFGGPGFEGMTAEDLDDTSFYAPYREVADVVVVGQRGIGFSRPNTRCEGPLAVPADSLLTTEQVKERRQAASQACKSFWQEQGLVLDGLNILEAAADVNAVREALGYDKIMLRGQSFGSHWSMAVMREYPDIVERAYLSGMEGPNATYDMPGGLLNSLRRVAEDAEQDEALAAHVPEGGFIQALEAIAARLERTPVTETVAHPETGAPVDVRLGYRDRSWLATGYGSVPDSLHNMAGWPRDVIALYEQDYEAASRSKAEWRTGSPGFPTASFFMLDCGSGITPERDQELNADPAVGLIGKPGAELYQHACPVWDSDLGDDFRTGFETDIPTVMVHGTWDLSTPLENAHRLESAFSNGTLVTVERGTHGAYWQAREASDAFAEAIDHFLKTGDMSNMPETVTLPEVDWIVP